MSLEFTERAQVDLDRAMGYYEDKSKGLGLRFLDCITQTINLIQQNPLLYPVKYQTIRGALIRKFPFTVFYSLHQETIVIQAVFNNRQDPQKRP